MINSPSIWGALKDAAEVGVFHLVGSGAPQNGVTGKYIAGRGCLYTDILTGTLYTNTGTKLNPTWGGTTLLDTRNVWAATFQSGQGVPVGDNQPSVTLLNGIRVFGNGLSDNDSGLVVTIAPEGSYATMIASANAGETIAMGVGLSGTLPYKPSINGPLVISATVQMVNDHLNRKFFIGFVGNPIDAILAPETFSAGNFTFNQPNFAGLVTDTGIGTTRDLYAVSNKGNATPVVPALGALTNAAFPQPLAANWTTLRVVISVDGTATMFVDDVQVAVIPNALDPLIDVAPVLLLGNTLNGATRLMNVSQFSVLGS